MSPAVADSVMSLESVTPGIVRRVPPASVMAPVPSRIGSRHQLARGNGRSARVGVAAAEHQLTGALLGDAARAGNRVAHDRVVAAVEGEGGIVCDAAGAERAGRAAAADLERAGRDRRGAGIRVAAGEDGRAAAGLGERA